VTAIFNETGLGIGLFPEKADIGPLQVIEKRFVFGLERACWCLSEGRTGDRKRQQFAAAETRFGVLSGHRERVLSKVSGSPDALPHSLEELPCGQCNNRESLDSE